MPASQFHSISFFRFNYFLCNVCLHQEAEARNFPKTTKSARAKVFQFSTENRLSMAQWQTCENAGSLACLTSCKINTQHSNIVSHTKSSSPSEESSGWRNLRRADGDDSTEHKAVEFNSLSRPTTKHRQLFFLRKQPKRSASSIAFGVEHKDKIRGIRTLIKAKLNGGKLVKELHLRTIRKLPSMTDFIALLRSPRELR